MWPIRNARAASAGTPRRIASSRPSLIIITAGAEVVSASAGSRIAICSTVTRWAWITGWKRAVHRVTPRS